MVNIGWKRALASLGMGSAAIAIVATAAHAEPYTAFLASGESATYEGYFWVDEDIYADCDEACKDLDIYLYDAASGELIASDTLTDAHPVVTAPYEGEFLVETVMVVCAVDVCQAWTDSDEGF